MIILEGGNTNETQVPELMQTHHHWKDYLPQPYVFSADGRNRYNK